MNKEIQIDWDRDLVSVLVQLQNQLNDIFEGTRYYATLNISAGDVIDIYVKGEKRRIGYVAPKKTKQAMHVVLSTDVINFIKSKVELPKDFDLREGRVMNYRKLRDVDCKKVTEIFLAIV